MKKIFPLLILSIFSLNSFAQETNLTLNQKTMSISGDLALPIKIDRQGRAKMEISTAPSFSYFVYEKLELLFSMRFSLEQALNDAGAVWPVAKWGLGAEARYYHSIKNLFLYMGLGYRFSLVGIYSFRNHLRIPLGILIPLSHNFALDINLPAEFIFGGLGYEGTEIPSAHIGFRYFF